MRKYTVPENMELTYLLGDHLGSTSLAVDADTGNVIETHYKPWGEVRFTTETKTLPTRYTFTGQYSHMSDDATDLGAAGFGLMFYNARWYDPYLNRFSQPDSIIPNPYNSQDWDRYSYARNNPIRYNDPTGHDVDCGIGDQYCDDLYHEYYDSWLPLAPNSSFETYVSAKDSYEFYYNHPEIALHDKFDSNSGPYHSWEDVDPYLLASIYSENVMHRAFEPVGDDLILREIDRLNTLRDSGGYVDPQYYYALIFGLLITMGPDGGDGGGSGNISFSSLGIKTTDHFFNRLDDWGITEQQALNVYLNGKKYTNQYGEWIAWDPKTKLAIRVDNTDYGAVTIWEQNQLPHSWSLGWFEE